MIDAAALALKEILSPPFRGVLLKSLALTVGLLAALWALLARVLDDREMIQKTAQAGLLAEGFHGRLPNQFGSPANHAARQSGIAINPSSEPWGYPSRAIQFMR